MDKIESFKIRLAELQSSNNWDIASSKTIKTIPCGKELFSHNPTIIVADPFLFIHNNKLYLFYEQKKHHTPGVLNMVSTEDLKNWTEPITVLKEDFHLSYPYVFEDNGAIYMIPETCAIGEVRLYKADDSHLTHFSKECILLDHKEHNSQITIDFSDSSVYKHIDGKYYLMTTLNINKKNQLYLYIADDLKGPYRKHPKSPIFTGNKYGRNGGSLLCLNEKLYRIAQDCVVRYGDNVHVFEITEMTETSYSEQIVKEYLFDTTIPFYSAGGHQLNMTTFMGKRIIATDAKEYRLYFINRIIRKFRVCIKRFFQA